MDMLRYAGFLLRDARSFWFPLCATAEKKQKVPESISFPTMPSSFGNNSTPVPFVPVPFVPERRAAGDDRFLASYSLCTPSTQKEEPGKNYGADISTLARMIEAGEL